ncbi:transglycosylase domain-containing protein [Limnothrix sp. FACHB-881]|uniref:transglycosylase domain-containing protein n=1 Tax=Limnothrix sp. FACHB-881 TaxID=2692819 RepID=UPI001686FCFA|nr:transglycosylase domain-containing protein [Limnothrix sp. FACHB-881]MBD2635466.1 transglycosylase domain-containing protein [Limnothrix sp. FACHB-881]
MGPNPTPPPPQPAKTILGRLRQTVTQLSRVQLARLKLAANANPPRIVIYEAGSAPRDYPLLGDYYLLGRSSKANDIPLNSPVVSTTHAGLRRVPSFLGSTFAIEDRDSTNGTFSGKKRINGQILRHREMVVLGPPELADSVRLQYVDPPTPLVQVLRYGLSGLAGAIGLVSLAVIWQWQGIQILPLPQAQRGPVIVVAGDGQPLQAIERRAHQEAKNLGEFSPYLKKALLASEDARYYWHFGVDPIGILRALVVNAREGELQQGASTLSQQLARTLYRDYVGSDNSAGRKIKEAIVALKLESFYGKDRLLLAYMNQVFLGGNLAGFEDAARFYFEKSARDLDLGEAAMLVGILPAPNRWNPARNYKTAVQRRDLVLQRMLDQGAVTLEEFKRARRSRVEVSPRAREILRSTRAPYFFNYVFEELEQLFGSGVAREGNFLIETRLNLAAQTEADRALQQFIDTQGGRAGVSQGAIVAIDPTDGAILAMSGGRSFEDSQFNRAANGLRQPGSTFKLFAYAAALEKGISPNTAYSCAPVNWMGQRFRGCRSGSGSLNMVSGVALSENPIALRVAEAVGLDEVIGLAQRLGVTSPLRKTPGLVLGESEATLLQMTGAFAAVANNGRFNHAKAITRVLDTSDCTDPQNLQTCRVMYDAQADQPGANQPVLSPQVAQTMTDLLRGVVVQGTGRSAAKVPGAVGKTGTTDDSADLWFIGYVPGRNLTAGVWLGNDTRKPTDGNSGQAAAVWGNFVSRLLP